MYKHDIVSISLEARVKATYERQKQRHTSPYVYSVYTYNQLKALTFELMWKKPWL